MSNKFKVGDKVRQLIAKEIGDISSALVDRNKNDPKTGVIDRYSTSYAGIVWVRFEDGRQNNYYDYWLKLASCIQK